MQKVIDIIQQAAGSLPICADQLRASLLPRIGFSSYPWLPRAMPLGASRFGGPADLPPKIPYPTAHGRPLLLLAQLNFADLPIERHHPLLHHLPHQGWLCLFLDVDGHLRGTHGPEPRIVALQFAGDAHTLVRHSPDPAPDATVWAHCHAVTVHPADHHLCLPDANAVDSPLPPSDRETHGKTYDDLKSEIDALTRTHHEVTLLGTPTLFNPDLRHSRPDPTEWMLLLQFDGNYSFLAGVTNPTRYLDRPSIANADFVQYFIRKSDYRAGRLDRGFLDYMQA